MIKKITKAFHEIVYTIMYSKADRDNWKMKMNEPLSFTIVYTPPAKNSKTE